MNETLEQKDIHIEYPYKRSDDEVAYQEFARKMAPQIGLINQSESAYILIDALKKSKYYDNL